MAKKKKSGTRTESRAEREARLQKAPEPFGPARYVKENWFRMVLTAIIMMAFCQLADQLWPGDYLVPGIVAFFVAQAYLYIRAARAEKKKTAKE